MILNLIWFALEKDSDKRILSVRARRDADC